MSQQPAFQELDPLGTLFGRPTTLVTASVIPVYAVVMTWINRTDIDYPVLAVLALALITGVSVALVLASNPLRAPFHLRWHIAVSSAAFSAYLLSAASMWNSNAYVRDDWGPVAVGLTLLTLSLYRPPREIASTGLFLALFAGVVALLQAHSFVTRVPAIMFALVTMLPILSMSLASATFGRVLIDGLASWRRRAELAVTASASESTDWIARSVQQDRVTILNRDVVPFFSELLQKGTVDDADRARARGISDAIRAVMIAEVDRTWLDAILEQESGHPAVDPQRLAEIMGTDQRTAIRALVVAIAGHADTRRSTLTLEIAADGDLCRAELAASLRTTENVLRGELAPYFAVMRIVFDDLKVEFSDGLLTLRFFYDQQ